MRGSCYFSGVSALSNLRLQRSHEQPVAAGAKITMPLADMFWGDRYAQLEDPFGHRWSVGTHMRDLSPAEIQEAMGKAGG